jgi:hypothetical protein
VSDAIATDGVVTLRRWREEDVDAIVAACQDADIQHWIPMIPRPYRAEHALAFVRGEIEGIGEHQYAIELGGDLAGSIGMTVNRNRTGHIGYWCVPDARGRGIVTRALGLLSRRDLAATARADHRSRQRRVAAGRGEGRLSPRRRSPLAPRPPGRAAPRQHHVLAAAG